MSTIAISENASSEPSQSLFPFMKLCPEIRRMVLEELLVMPSPVYTPCLFKNGGFAVDPTKTTKTDNEYLQDALLYDMISNNCKIAQAGICQIFLVSRTLYREAVPIYFGSNVFYTSTLKDTAVLTRSIGPDCRWQLRKLSVCYHGRAPARSVKAIAECRGLKELTLNVFQYSFLVLPNKEAPLQIYGQKELLRIRGLSRLEINYEPCLCLSDWLWFDNLCDIRSKFEEFVEMLQVLKQPHDLRWLKRQEAKDFPQKARRTVFGEANVVTRSESKLLAKQSGQR